ncbi:MAG: glutaredoxin domain-containing protein [Chloroflexota bacterium]|nr:glutaredoxin domain-containing protein [Chloroflexota bacterium]
MYVTKWCADTVRALRILKEQEIDYVWVDITKNLEGAKLVKRINHGFRSVPTIIFPDQSILVEPSNDPLREKLRALNLDKQVD